MTASRVAARKARGQEEGKTVSGIEVATDITIVVIDTKVILTDILLQTPLHLRQAKMTNLKWIAQLFRRTNGRFS